MIAQNIRRVARAAALTVGTVVLLMGLAVVGSVSLEAQGPFSAQIQAALRVFVTQATTWTGAQTFGNVTINGTCTGSGCAGSPTDASILFSDITTNNSTTSKHGFMPKLSGNAYDFTLGNGTYGHTIARGTIVANDPWIFSVTDNNAAVSFTALKLAITETVTNNNNCGMEIYAGAAGTSRMFGLCQTGGGTMDGVFSGRVYLGNAVPDNYVSAIAGTGRVLMGNISAGWASIFGVLSSTCVSGCGTSPTIEGNATSTWVTLGTTPSTTTVVLGLGVDLINGRQACYAYDQTTNVYLAWAATSTQITLTGTFVAGHVLTVSCIGHF